jgi:hypothetical protein
LKEGQLLKKMNVLLGVLFYMHSLHGQVWEPWPWVSAQTRSAGFIGGEGGQVIRAIETGPADSNFVILGTDVGGLYKSADFGANWEPCNVGFSACGSNAFAIDPCNPDRILAMGCNSSPQSWNGLYLSEDKAKSWKQVKGVTIAGLSETNDQIAFDPTSYSGTSGFCTTAYWSRESEKNGIWGEPEVHPAVYKTRDGGETWSEMPGSGTVAGGPLKVQPGTGHVFAGNGKGLFESSDGGDTFVRVLDAAITGLDISFTHPETVVVCTRDGNVMRSSDGGVRFEKISEGGANRLPKNNEFWRITVSPVSARVMAMTLFKTGGSWWDWTAYTTRDGGATWRAVAYDRTNCFCPDNQRGSQFAWSCSDSTRLLGTGRGDWAWKSVDSGMTFKWSYNGVSAVMQGGYFNFSVENPDVALMTTQDYDCALTADGGNSWKYMNMSGNGWGGFIYGGYAVNANVAFGGVAPGWGGTRTIFITWDGGRTFKNTGVEMAETAVCLSAPGHPDVLFAGSQRSEDQGRNWNSMHGCTGVFTCSPSEGRELYGRDASNRVVRSTDQGSTWAAVSAALSPPIEDLAYDHLRNRIYAAGGDQLQSVELSTGTVSSLTSRTPKDQFGNRRFNTVAVDPVNPDVVYAGGSRGEYQPSVCVVRSVNGGGTWISLTGKEEFGKDGGVDPICMRVHPVSRRLHVGTMCHGQWTIGPPGGGSGSDGRGGGSPQNGSLFPNYPNPFNPGTRIPYRIARESHVLLEVYNVMGGRVAILVDSRKTPGAYESAWNGRDSLSREAADGVYLCRLTVQEQYNRIIRTEKLMKIR